MKKSEVRFRDLQDIIKLTNINIMGIPEGEKREKGAESLSEGIMVKNFPNLGKEMDIQIEETRRRQRTLDSNTKTYESIKLTGKCIHRTNTGYCNTVMMVGKSRLILA